MVEAEHLTKAYGKHIALRDVSFTLEKGKLYGLLGVNGAGKTTTLQLLSGYLEPSEGEVRIDGISMEKDPVSCKKRVGYLPEIPPLYPELTVSEYLRFLAELKGLSKNERAGAVEEALKRGGLRKYRKRLIGQLSKGLRQRVGLAGVMIGEPDVLLLDEPVNGLDPVQIVAMREVLQELKRDRVIVVSSHVLSEIQQIADQYLIIADGRLVYRSGETASPGDASDMDETGDLEEIFLRVTEEAYRRNMQDDLEEDEPEDDEDEDEEV